MDSAALTSLTPLLEGIDRWVELLPLLPVIISLELVLSADNAIALASITKRLNDLAAQKLALNIGITFSLIFRIILILTAQWVLQYWQFQFCAGIYLLFLFINKIIASGSLTEDLSDASIGKSTSDPSNYSITSTIILLAFTDLAFSIDSVAAAVSISDQILLVITGALIGVLALRFTSGLFIKWLEEFVRLELSGYIAVGLVGFKLLISLIFSNIDIPEWMVFFFMALLFTWGFSKRKQVANNIAN